MRDFNWTQLLLLGVIKTCLLVKWFIFINSSAWPDFREELTLRKLYFHFLSHWMGYDRGDSFPFDFEPNGFSFGLKSKWKLSPRSYPIQCERKWKYSFLSVLTRELSIRICVNSKPNLDCNYTFPRLIYAPSWILFAC